MLMSAISMPFADKTKLQEIYLNIVGNAVKYTPSGKSIHVIVKEIASDDKMHNIVLFVKIQE